MAGTVAPIDRRKVFEASDKEVLKLMEEDWHESEQYFGPHFDHFRRFDKMYDAEHVIAEATTKEQGGWVLSKTKRSRNFYPITTVIVDTLFAIISSTIFGFKDFFELAPTQPFEAEEHRYALKNWLIWELSSKRVNFRTHFDSWLRQALKYRWSVARVGYQIAGKNVMKQSKLTAADILAEEPPAQVMETLGTEGMSLDLFRKLAEEILTDKVLSKIPHPAFEILHDPTGDERPVFEVFNTYYTRPDPHSTDFDERARFFGDEISLSWTWLLENTKSKENPDAAYEKAAVNKLKKRWFGEEGRPGIGRSIQGRENAPAFGHDQVVLRRWRNQYAEFVSSLDYKILLRRAPKDGWDLFKMVFWPKDNQWEGASVIERIEKLNLEINDIANSRRDNVHLSVDGIAAVNALKVTEEENPDLHLSYSGKLLKCDGNPKDLISYFYPKDVTQAAREEIRFVMDIIERLVAVGEPVQGQFAMSQRTATEHEQVAAGLATRMRPIIDRLERDNVSPVLTTILNQDMLNMTAEKAFTVLGTQGLYVGQMSPEILSKYGPNIDVIPMGSTYEVNNYLSRIILLETINVMAKTQMNDIVDWTEMAYLLIESTRIKGGTQLIRDDPTMQHSVPPELENALILELGHQLVVNNRDNVQEHYASHQKAMMSPEFDEAPELNQMYLQVHLTQTEEQLKQLQQVRPGPVEQPQVDFQGETLGEVAKGFNPMARAPINTAGGMPR